MSGEDNSSNEFIISKRLSHIFYILISNKFCTLKEIRDDYDIDEVLDIYEICMVSLYNKAIGLKRRN